LAETSLSNVQTPMLANRAIVGRSTNRRSRLPSKVSNRLDTSSATALDNSSMSAHLKTRDSLTGFVLPRLCFLYLLCGPQ
jgi:hypothetical protein